MSGPSVMGREIELGRIDAAVSAALAGRGALLLFAGEAGIGKTSLAEAFAAKAAAAGAQVAWGRCWEAGGAPPYWPWTQAFRSLGLGDPFATAQGEDAGKEARFRLFDRAEEALSGLARARPVALVMDDLHAADLPSLLLLCLVARNLKMGAGARLAIVATWREAEARLAGEPGEVLAKLAREGELLLPARLSMEQIERWIRDEQPDASDESIRRVQASSEGNPLFVRELLRAGDSLRGGRVPETLRALLDERVARVSATTRELLSVAAVIGREWSDGFLLALAGPSGPSGISEDTVALAVEEGVDAGLVVAAGSGRHAFSHMLLRDRLLGALSPSRRAAVHTAAGERLWASGEHTAAAAQHLFEGGDPRAAMVAHDAGKRALSRLAFEDAAALGERALAVAQRETRLGVELLLLRAQALIHLGDARGRGLAVEAGALAERLGEPRLLGEAALVHGGEMMIGANDPTLIDLLERARAALGEGDDPLLCRVLARLSAAIAPPRDHEAMARAPRLAREAIAMARRLGDREALLVALRLAVGSIGCGKSRVPVLDELVQLAGELDRPLVLLESLGLHAMTLRERGAMAAMTHSRDRWAALLAEHPRPQYAWRLPLHLAMAALLDGESERAAELAEAGWQIAEASGNVPGRVAWALHRLGGSLLTGEPMAAPEVERAALVMARMAGPNFGRALLHGTMLHDDREARLLLGDVRLPLAQGDSFEILRLAAVSEVAVQLRDEGLALLSADGLAAHCRDTPVFWGPHGVGLIGPMALLAARVLSLLGRDEEAHPLFDEALALAERMHAPALAARVVRERDALGPRRTARHAAPGPAPRRFAMAREGDVWRIDTGSGARITLKDAKGLSYLAELTSQPGRELHVTQLAGIDELGGDAGPALDARAKAAYQERLHGLRERLEEARSHGNFAVAERAEAEIDALVTELARAVGLGGRDRKVGSPVERARINVQRRVKDAIRRIGEHEPALAAWLEATIKTGTFCIFRPV